MAASYPSATKSFTTKVDGPGNTIAAAHVNDLQDEVVAIENGLRTGLAHDLVLADNFAVTLGTGGDADIVYDGTDLLIKPAVVGAGDLVVQGASIEFDDSEGVTLGTGKDATLRYDGTDVVFNTAAVGTGALSLTKGMLKFPGTQNPSTDVNTLDDYEEGSWTPVLGGSGGTSGQVYSSQVGKYTKIGKRVFFQGYLALSTKGTITTAVQIQGLPFTSENVSNQYSSSAVWFNTLTTNWINVVAYVNPNATTMDVVGMQAAAVSMTSLATADIANTTQIMVSGHYNAAA
jgi:hypothetical protein